MGRRIECTLPRYEGGYVILPDEWLGIHIQRRDEAVEAAAKYNSRSLTQFVIALALAEEWGGFPGLEGDPQTWDVSKFPAALIFWFNRAVTWDFLLDGAIPKEPSSQSTEQQAEGAAREAQSQP